MRATVAWIRLALNPDEMWRQDLLEAARRPSRRINRLSAELVPAGIPLTLSDLARLARGLERRQAEAWSGWISDIGRVAEAGSTGKSGAVLDELIDSVGLSGAADLLDRGRTRVDRAAHSDDLVALRRTAVIYRELGDFEDRLRTLLRRHSRQTEPDADGVTLSTVHRVKGMEWDRVVVFGVDDGLMPHSLCQDTEEERRVLHVALTRGRRRVLVVADADRPSRFLAELRGETARAVTVPDTPDEPIHDAASRRAGLVDDDLLEALKAWRREAARERGVPPYVVLWDRTLDEIAAARPHSEEELLEVRGIGPAKLDEYGEDILEIVLGAPASRSRAEIQAGPVPGGSVFPPRHTADHDSRPVPPADQNLLEELKDWRARRARESGVPAYIVFTNRSLEDIAAARPRTQEELLGIYGVGPTKLETYGEKVLELCGNTAVRDGRTTLRSGDSV